MPDSGWEGSESLEAFKSHIRSLCEHNASELAIMKVLIAKLDGDLFGGSGRTGRLDKIDGACKELDKKVDDNDAAMVKRVSAIERYLYIALGSLGLISFLTGSGVVSLKALIGK